MKNALVVIYESKEFITLDKSVNKKLSNAVETEGVSDKDAFTVEVNYASDEFPYISIVKSSAETNQDWRDFGGKMFKKYYGVADMVVFKIDSNQVENIYEGFKLASYNFTKYKSDADTKTLDIQIDADIHHDALLNESVSDARNLIT